VIEVLVAIAILAILLALLLSAVQKVRLHSMRVHASNGIRQVLLSSHHSASANQDYWPTVDGDHFKRIGGLSVFCALCPYLEADMDHPPEFIRFKSDPSTSLSIPEPPPPSPFPGGKPIKPGPPIQLSVTSLALNPLVYGKGKHLPSSTPDGTAATIAITEHYGFCDQAQFDWAQLRNDCYDPSMKKIPCTSSSMRRSTFADGEMFHDVMPVTTQGENRPVTVGSLPLTFQVRPPLNQCDPRIPQSSFPGGILCEFADGSVRFINQNVSQSAFWGSVTPDRGETVSLD
jgi:hypothetical protein